MDDSTEPATLVGIAVSGLIDDASIQMELGLEEGEVERAGSQAADTGAAVDRQVDEIRRKFGNAAVTRAGLLGRQDRDAPDEFRKLAEKD
jgi:DNA polymerase-4